MTSLGPIVWAVSLPRGLYTHCCWLCWHFWHTHKTTENVSQTLLHTVSRKHVVQPLKRSKTLGTGVSLNVPLPWCHERRPIILEGRSFSRFRLKIMKANAFFYCGLTCMDELFTTKIAMCANKINIVNFDFTQTLILNLKCVLMSLMRIVWSSNNAGVLSICLTLSGFATSH